MSHIQVAYGLVEGEPEHTKTFRRGDAERRKSDAAACCADLARRGYKEVTPYLIKRDGETAGYWEVTTEGLGEFVEMDG